jgi:hypothetical protein
LARGGPWCGKQEGRFVRQKGTGHIGRPDRGNIGLQVGGRELGLEQERTLGRAVMLLECVVDEVRREGNEVDEEEPGGQEADRGQAMSERGAHREAMHSGLFLSD